jgi:hypothetical protein
MPRSGTIEERLASIERDLDRKLTLAEHLMVQVHEMTIDGGSVDLLVRIDPTRIKGRPVEVRVAECRDATTGSAVSLTGSLRWEYASATPGNASIRIPSIPGGVSGTPLFLRLVIGGG